MKKKSNFIKFKQNIDITVCLFVAYTMRFYTYSIFIGNQEGNITPHVNA